MYKLFLIPLLFLGACNFQKNPPPPPPPPPMFIAECIYDGTTYIFSGELYHNKNGNNYIIISEHGTTIYTNDGGVIMKFSQGVPCKVYKE